MTPERIKELRGLLDKATRRRWVLRPNLRLNHFILPNDYGSDETAIGEAFNKADADLITAAVNALPDLLTLAERALSAEAERDALDAKVQALSPHGTCACSYDKPGDVCLHHSPKLVAAEAREQALREALRPFEHLWPNGSPVRDDEIVQVRVRVGDLRRVRAALAQGEKDG